MVKAAKGDINAETSKIEAKSDLEEPENEDNED